MKFNHLNVHQGASPLSSQFAALTLSYFINHICNSFMYLSTCFRLLPFAIFRVTLIHFAGFVYVSINVLQFTEKRLNVFNQAHSQKFVSVVFIIFYCSFYIFFGGFRHTSHWLPQNMLSICWFLYQWTKPCGGGVCSNVILLFVAVYIQHSAIHNPWSWSTFIFMQLIFGSCACQVC